MNTDLNVEIQPVPIYASPAVERPGDEIRFRRRAVGWGQAELGRVAGVSVATVNRVETNRNTSIDTLNRLRVALSGVEEELRREQQIPAPQPSALKKLPPAEPENPRVAGLIADFLKLDAHVQDEIVLQVAYCAKVTEQHRAVLAALSRPAATTPGSVGASEQTPAPAPAPPPAAHRSPPGGEADEHSATRPRRPARRRPA